MRKMDNVPNTPLDKLTDSFSLRISEHLRQLLESKHLYQNIQIEYQDLVDAFEGNAEFIKDITQKFTQLVNDEWCLVDPAGRRMIFPTNDSTRIIWFKAPDVKLFCEICGRIEAFNVVSAEDFLQRRRFDVSVNATNDRTLQVFVISFQCQSCKPAPEVFLIRRRGMKLTISGRAPIEHVTVPSVLPKTLQRFYSGAVVAHQSGQTLAGLFLLRTLIEQWVRQPIDTELKADEVLDKYMLTLPNNFRQQFVSIRDLYGKISVDIHSATGCESLFDEASSKIVEHFEARRLFEL